MPRKNNEELRRKDLPSGKKKTRSRGCRSRKPNNKVNRGRYWEERMAKLLDDNNIKYTANRSFKTVNKKGYRNHREVDFCLHEDLSVLRREHPIRYIEVKSGKLDRDQQEDLRNAGIYTDIIIPLDIIYWEIHGLSLQK